MTSERGVEDGLAAAITLRPNLKVLIGGSFSVALISAVFLPWPLALASTTLGAFMLAGADIDARTFLLPDLMTAGALLSGLLAAAIFDPVNAWFGVATATARAAGTALVLVSVFIVISNRREQITGASAQAIPEFRALAEAERLERADSPQSGLRQEAISSRLGSD